MAIRRPLIDVIDRGMDPKVAHSKLDKKGNLIGPQATPTNPVVLAVVPDVKNENLLNVEKKDVLTEEVEKSEEKQKPEIKTEVAKAPEVKKTDKAPKPA